MSGDCWDAAVRGAKGQSLLSVGRQIYEQFTCRNFRDAGAAWLVSELFCHLYFTCFHTGYQWLAVFSNRKKKRLKRKTKSLKRMKIIKGGQQDERGIPLWPADNLASEASALVVTERTVQCSAISP